MQGSEKLCLQWNDFKENVAYPTSDVEMTQSENNGVLEDQIRSMITSSGESLRNAGISASGMVYTCKVCGKKEEKIQT